MDPRCKLYFPSPFIPNVQCAVGARLNQKFEVE